MKKLNTYMYEHYHNEMLKYHGNNEKWEEWGFHLVQWDGARQQITIWWRTRNAINTVIDSFTHFGLFPTKNKKRILNEDGNKNASWKVLASRFNQAVKLK